MGATDLFMWRLVTGLFLGGCLPSCLAIVTAETPVAKRGVAIMMLFMGYGAGATVAGLVVAAFADAGGWRAVMVVVGAACIVTAIAAWLWSCESVPRRASSATTVRRPTRAHSASFRRATFSGR